MIFLLAGSDGEAQRWIEDEAERTGVKPAALARSIVRVTDDRSVRGRVVEPEDRIVELDGYRIDLSPGAVRCRLRVDEALAYLAEMSL